MHGASSWYHHRDIKSHCLIAPYRWFAHHMWAVLQVEALTLEAAPISTGDITTFLPSQRYLGLIREGEALCSVTGVVMMACVRGVGWGGRGQGAHDQ
jgi:hypothetical protein